MAEYHVESFGCRASQADGEAICTDLQRRGHSAAGDYRTADVLILNTCSVTAEADREARSYLRRALRANPGVRVVMTGCYAQRAPQEVAALAGVDRVIGNSHKGWVGRMAAGLADATDELTSAPDFFPLSKLAASPVLVDDTFAHAEMESLLPAGIAGRGALTRPNLKVQDGCGNRCSFCVIPQTRGGSRSVGLEKVLGEVRAFVEGGGQELVLSGINLGRWGRDLRDGAARDLRFEDLVEAVLLRTRLPRLRISSVEPMDWSDRLLDLYRQFAGGEHPRLARHAHLPLQSGADATLRAMYRRYRPWHYAAKLEGIRKALPDAAIGADVMVGFPGETDALFEESFRFIEQQPFTYLHLFPFSARPGTPAWTLQKEKPVAGEAVRERMARLRGLMEGKSRGFRETFVGRELSVVTLQGEAGTRAISDNFLTVEMGAGLAANRLVRVKVEGLTATGLMGAAAPGYRQPADDTSSMAWSTAW